MAEIKDPLGVVAKWREEEQAHHFTGWDDVKYGWGGIILVAVLVVSPFLIIWALWGVWR